MPGSSPGMTSVCLRRHLVSETRLRDLAAGFARGLPETFLSLQTEGAGNTGCALHPRSRVQKVHKINAHEHTGSAEAIRHSLRNGFNGLFRALPGDRAFLPPSPALLSANLTPASGRQDHTSSPSASHAVRQERIRVHRIPPPTSVTIAKRPSVWDGMANHIVLIWE